MCIHIYVGACVCLWAMSHILKPGSKQRSAPCRLTCAHTTLILSTPSLDDIGQHIRMTGGSVRWTGNKTSLLFCWILEGWGVVSKKPSNLFGSYFSLTLLPACSLSLSFPFFFLVLSVSVSMIIESHFLRFYGLVKKLLSYDSIPRSKHTVHSPEDTGKMCTCVCNLWYFWWCCCITSLTTKTRTPFQIVVPFGAFPSCLFMAAASLFISCYFCTWGWTEERLLPGSCCALLNKES